MKQFQVPKPPDDTLRDILALLMDKGKVGGVFALAQTGENSYSYALITDKELLDHIVPTLPLMPANAGRMVSRLTMLEPVKTPIAVIMRPCELRALFERVKLEQARLDNLLFISYTCGGVLEMKTAKDGLQLKLEEYWKQVGTGGVSEDLRNSCRVCENFVPSGADITLALVGNENGKQTTVQVNSEKGEEFLAGLSYELTEADPEPEVLDSMRKKRAEQKPDVFGQFAAEELGMAGLTALFGRCIGCHACGRACPVCYCSSCHFDAAESDFDPSTLEAELTNRGALRLPTGTLYYQIGRLLHVSISCVGCGMCSDACPVDIPVALIFAKLAGSVQGMFGYVSGRSVEEKIPTSTFEMEELEEIGA